jgi:hypothetical protein
MNDGTSPPAPSAPEAKRFTASATRLVTAVIGGFGILLAIIDGIEKVHTVPELALSLFYYTGIETLCTISALVLVSIILHMAGVSLTSTGGLITLGIALVLAIIYYTIHYGIYHEEGVGFEGTFTTGNTIAIIVGAVVMITLCITTFSMKKRNGG